MIYIVDDSADYRFLLQQTFVRSIPDRPVRFFPGGNDLYAFVQADGEQPDLVVLDLNMPGLSGHQTLVLLRQYPSWKQVPVVMMSSAASAGERDACYEAGASSFLEKPTDFGRLAEQMKDLCHDWPALNRSPVNSRWSAGPDG